jgi:heptosyltransferase-2
MQTQNASLVVGPSWIGDMVMAQSLLIALKSRFPNQPIDVLAPSWSLPVIARMHQVRSGLASPFAHGDFSLIKRWNFAQTLKNQYSDAYVLPRSFKSALIPFFAGIKHRVGYLGEQRYGLINHRVDLPKEHKRHTARNFFALAEVNQPLPYPHLSVDSANFVRLKTRFQLDDSLVAIMPGAEYGPAKQWPAAYWAQLVNQLTQQHYQVIALGSKKDETFARDIARLAPSLKILCGQTELVDAIDLLAHVEFCVSNDSGLMHVAAAVDVHVFAIYGSSSPSFTPPLTDKKTVFYQALDCSPCLKRVCPYGHTRCLTEIEPAMVIEEIKRWICAR